MLKGYLQVIFQPDLLFNLLCILSCFAAAIYYGHANLQFAELAVVGAVLIQMSINLVDDYIDSKSIDKKTVKTRFSGGSGLIVNRKVNGKFILLVGLAAGFIATLIALYLAYWYPIILPFVIFAVLALSLYDKFLSKVAFVAEPLLMICFTLLNFGAFIIIHGSIRGLLHIGFVFIPLGILVGIYSLITTVPDKKIYRNYGRKDAAIILGNKRVASYYMIYQIIVYASITIGILVRALPFTFLILFLTAPMVFSIYSGIKNYRKAKSYEKYMAINLYNTLAFFVLVIIAYLLG